MNSKVDYRDSFPILSTRSFTRRAAEKFEFIINLKAAKQIGLTIPPNVIVVTGVGDLRSAKEATATIPIVMVVEVVSSPVWRKTPRC